MSGTIVTYARLRLLLLFLGRDARVSECQGGRPRAEGDARVSEYRGGRPRCSVDARVSECQGGRPRAEGDARVSEYRGGRPRESVSVGSITVETAVRVCRDTPAPSNKKVPNSDESLAFVMYFRKSIALVSLRCSC